MTLEKLQIEAKRVDEMIVDNEDANAEIAELDEKIKLYNKQNGTNLVFWEGIVADAEELRESIEAYDEYI